MFLGVYTSYPVSLVFCAGQRYCFLGRYARGKVLFRDFSAAWEGRRGVWGLFERDAGVCFRDISAFMVLSAGEGVGMSV